MFVALGILGPPVRGNDDLAREAARFAKESYFLSQNGRESDALEKIEVAVALAPENLAYRKNLYDLLNGRFRRLIGRENKRFAWDSDKGVLLFDKDGLRDVVQSALHIEAIVDSFPPDHDVKKYRNSYLAYMRHDLTRLVERLDIGFQEEVHALNLRVLVHWRKRHFLPARDGVVDQATFREYIKAVNATPNTFASQRVEDIIEPYEELVESMLRFSREYELSEGDPLEPSDTRYIRELYENFSRVSVRYRSKFQKNPDKKLVTSIERTISRLERDTRRLPRIFGWIARNRYDFYGPKHHDADARASAKSYSDKLGKYLSAFPRDIPYADYSVLYDELYHSVRYICSEHDAGYYSDAALPIYAEILELAESRGEYARWTIRDLISHLKVFLDQTEKNRDNVRKDLDRYQNLIRSQLDLAEKKGIGAKSGYGSVEELREMAVQAGLLPGKSERIRPWKDEILLLPKDSDAFASIVVSSNEPYIYGRKLYVPAFRRSEKKSSLAVIELTPDDSGGYPVEYLGTLPSGPILQYVDAKNAYVWSRAGKDPMGLYVYPLDGSESWRLTTEEELPSGNVHVYGGFDGLIFMVVGGGWIVRVDTKTRDWKILSSPYAKTGETPFVDGRKPGFQGSCDDLARNRILLFGRGGIWAIDRVTKKFVFLRDAKYSSFDFFTFTPEGNLWMGDRSAFSLLSLEGTYDPPAKKSLTLHSFVQHDGRKIACETYAGTVYDGYLWGGLKTSNHMDWNWARCSVKDDENDRLELELLAIPESIEGFPGVERSRWFPSYCAPLPDGKGLLVGTHGKIVLLRFE